MVFIQGCRTPLKTTAATRYSLQKDACLDHTVTAEPHPDWRLLGLFKPFAHPLESTVSSTDASSNRFHQPAWLVDVEVFTKVAVINPPAIFLTLLCCRQAAAAAQQPGHVEGGAAHLGDGSGGHGGVRHQRAAAGCGESLADNRQLVIATEHSSLQQCWTA